MISTKSILVAATLAIAASTAALAAEGDHQGWRHHMSAEDRAAFLDARIAALKTGLKLTPDQEKNWAPIEAAIREEAKARAERFAAWRQQRESSDQTVDLIGRLQHRSEMLTTRAADIQKLIGAAKPLYDSLDDGQKHRFGALLRVAFNGHHHQRRQG